MSNLLVAKLARLYTNVQKLELRPLQNTREDIYFRYLEERNV
jgi:hypothetical protein